MAYIPFLVVPFILSLILTPIVRAVAIKNGFVSYPRPDRWHKLPTALMGGIGIYLAWAFSIFYLGVGLPNKNTQGLFFGGTFLFLVGLLDDKFQFKPYTKLFCQIIAGCIAVASGVMLALPVHILLVIPLTLLWVIIVTNSFNLLDNIDGLAAGIAAISSIMLFFSSQVFSNNELGIFALVLSGAILGFLPYNFNPAKIFMGDSGSMFLGYSLAVISISGTPRHISNFLITMLIPVLILGVPIFDTVFVMVLRKLQGRSIFAGGKDHTSHHLVILGLSQKKTVLLLYCVSIAFGLIAILYSRLNAFIVLVVTLLSTITLLYFGFFISEGVNEGIRVNKNGDKAEAKTALSAIFLYKRRIIEVLLDFVLICVAYYSSYFLRFEGSFLPSNIYLIKESLVWIILIKMSIFFIFGLYRGVWKYVSISDLLTIFKVVSIGSVSSVLFLTFIYRFRDYSRAVFFIDWLILFFLVSGSRVIFRVLGEFLSRLREKGKNILVFGAGDTGEMVIREIKRNKALNYNAIGFIDDDPVKIGNKIQGVAVLGPRSKIKELVDVYAIKEIVIAISSLDMDSFLDIVNICKDCNIPYRRIKGIMDKEETTRI